jgi:hypothetical protein
MKEQTADKFIRKTERFFLYAQVVFSWFIILFGYGTALRVLFTHYDRFADKIFYTVCFSLIGLSSQKLMLRTSLEELREAKKEDEHE